MPAASLLKEVSEGCKWRTRANIPEKCIDVIRVS